MTKSLVIVESPAKARTITKYLGSEFIVESSVGHIRDLPKKATATGTRLSIPKDASIELEMLLIWGRFPVPKDERTVAKAKSIPTHFKLTFLPNNLKSWYFC